MLWSELEVVSFDLGGTLIDDAGGAATLEIANVLGVPLPVMRTRLAGAKTIRCDTEDLAAALGRDFGRPDAVPGIVALLRRRRAESVRPRLYPDVERTVRTLRDRGYRIAFLSNVLGCIAPEPAATPLARLADAVLLSCDTGWVKPDRRAFAAVERALGVPGTRIVHVGDSFGADVAGALVAGWSAVHLDRTSTGRHHRAPAGPDRWCGICELCSLVDLIPARPPIPLPPREGVI